MLRNDLIGFGLFIGYFIVAGAPLILLKAYHKTPFEVTRKLYHFVIVLSIFPLLKLFSAWYAAALASLTFTLIVYPILALVEHSAFYKRIAVEREEGEFRSSFIIVQLSLATLIFIFWGLLGIDWQYVAVVAVMAWGFGDAAAALVGKALGRRKISHPRITGTKTVEGTLAMVVVAGLSIFLTLLIYAGQPWYVGFTVAALVAPVCAVVELFSPRGMDTITVPLSAAFAILPLMSLFSFLGV
ncbi:MAG TPA: phosphatidate cytidylyltransferase [Anaerolineae bacterium]|nr:phosphatidate cytidylyltransferase [Anaerolineae bacterium]